MPGLSSLDIAQKSCALVGIQPITSFTPTNPTAVETALDENYSVIVEGELAAYHYDFSRKIGLLSRNAAEPLARWDASYGLPADHLALRSLFFDTDDTPQDYARYGGDVYCNATSTQSVYLEYTFKQNEQFWPPLFVQGVIHRVGALLASAVQERQEHFTALNARASEYFIRAQQKDYQSSSAKKLRLGRLVRARRGRFSSYTAAET
jgi:hypothetical protein